MNEEQNLLRAISDHPWDDQPRLAYAEWLGCHGHSDRADFIRLQCEVAAHDLNESHESYRMAETLLFTHWEDWTAALRALGMATRIHFMPDDSYAPLVLFRRGFINGLVLTAEHFVLLAEKFAAAAPLAESLALRNTLHVLWQRAEGIDPCTINNPRTISEEIYAMVGGSSFSGFQDPTFLMKRLSRMPLLFKNLRYLDLSQCALTAAALAPLPWCRLLSELTHIELWGNQLGDGGAHLVANMDSWFELQEISLDDNEITDDGAAALAESRGFTNLTRLTLTGNNITETGAARLRARFGDRVEV